MTKKIEFIIFDDFCCPKVSKIGIVENPEYHGLITKGGRLKISFCKKANINLKLKNMKENKNIITIEIDAEKLFSGSKKEELLFQGIKDTLARSKFLEEIQDRLIQKILEDKMAEDIKKSFLEKFTKWTTTEIEKAVSNCNYAIYIFYSIKRIFRTLTLKIKNMIKLHLK